MTHHIDMFFALLRLSLNRGEEYINNSIPVFSHTDNKDWDLLFNLSVRQGVLLLSYGGLQYLPVKYQPSHKLKLRWCVNVIKGRERYEHYESVIAKLSNLFSDNSIDLLIIKGITISELYPIPYFRESGDIDIYLSDEAEQANELILSLGMRKEGGIPKHSTFVVEGVPIENHYTFFDTVLEFKKEGLLYQKMENILKSMLFEKKRLSPDYDNVSQLSPQAAALHFIGHTFRHFCSLDMNIRQMCDWTMFFSKYEKNIDIELLSSQVKELGLEKFVCHINAFCSGYLAFRTYFMHPSEADKKASEFILKTIMQYRVVPPIHIPVFWVLQYLFRRNIIYKRYLGKVNNSEFLFPELKSYFKYLFREGWTSINRKKRA